MKNRALKLPSRPRPGSRRVSGSAYESDGDDSDGQGAPQGGGGCKAPPSRPAQRTFSFAGFKGSRGQFHEKYRCVILQPQNRQNPAVSFLVFFSPVCMARGGDTIAQMESWTTARVLSAWKLAPFFDGQKIPKSPQSGGSNPCFRHMRLDLAQTCVARSACRRVAALQKISHQNAYLHTSNYV